MNFMIIEIIIALLIGVILGTFTGLTPGIHINLVSIIVIESALITSNINPLAIMVFIVAMSITHTFVDFIPSIYLGAPNEDTALSTMPGHRMLLKGNGHKAVLLTIIGSSLGSLIFILITPLFFLFISTIYPFFQNMMAWILIWISILMILNEKNSKIFALIIFILSGFIGIATLNLTINQPLLPLLSGLFGSSTLIYSINQHTKIPKQKITPIKLNKKDLVKPTISTSIITPIFSFLPGLGSSQAAIVSSQIFKQTQEQFLILLGSINTFVMSASFLVLYLIDKARTGSAAAISQIPNFALSPQSIIILYIAIILSSLIAIPITINISKIFSKNIHKIDYSKISFATLIILTIIVLYFSGLIGFIVFITSTILGITCTLFNVRKGFLMGSLLIPTILFYLPI